MAHLIIPSVILSILFLLLTHVATSSSANDRRPYIIHMDKSAMPAPFTTHHDWYTSTVSSLSVGPDGVAASHLYTYNHVISGFSAVMTQAQVDELQTKSGHISTFPETYAKLHTTHTPQFLGLNTEMGLWPNSHFGDDMIIGIIDTGVWPESDMFRDDGMPPVPARWQGACENGTAFNSSNCNRKLIGARSFSKGLKEAGLNISTTDDYDSPRDFFGHGTHTASTAAGTWTPGVDFFGYAKGTAVGVAPRARVAMYKVLFTTDTFESASTDILAGMDQAIVDGVDLMSLSLGLPQTPYYSNIIALGAFAAMEKGIFVSCSAGNSGSDGYTIYNGAPWITTVGASTIDRDFAATISLGDGVTSFQGKSFYPLSVYISGVPLYYGYGNTSKETCAYNSLDSKEVAGKIIFCSFGYGDPMEEADRTGAKGVIFVDNSTEDIFTSDFYIPSVMISIEQGEIIKKYVTGAAEPPTVDIKFQVTVLGSKPAPQVAFFSSRGPNEISPWILKPDVVGPGVLILAAWAPNHGFQPIGNDMLTTDYALISGTSMSSPHIVGVAALLRAAHRDWSPAAVRSALMTTAYKNDNTWGPILDMDSGKPATPLDFGAGHIDPNKAMDPGLIYDIAYQDYVDFLCGLNYTSYQIKIITRTSNYTCTKANLDLNYPSFMVILNNTNSSSMVFNRVLTNVMDSPSVYHAAVNVTVGMKVVVDPPTLKFDGKYSKQGFTLKVDIDVSGVGKSGYLGNYGYLTWYEDGGEHVVRSPIVSAFAM